MERTQKKEAVAQLNQAFQDHSGVLLIDFTGLNVAEETELRRRIAASGSRYQVVKNTLALLAAQETPVAQLKDHFRGPTGVAMTADNPVALAKALNDFLKTHPSTSFKAGVLDEAVISQAEVAALADMPSREELLGKLLYLLQAPLTQLAAALQSPLRNLASILKQLEEKKDNAN